VGFLASDRSQASDPATASGAGVRWDLSLIAADAAEARGRLESLVGAAEGFASQYKGQVAALTPERLLRLLDELGGIKEETRVLSTYVELRLAADAEDAEAHDLSVVTERDLTAVSNSIRFFELEWLGLTDKEAETLISDASLDSYRYYLLASRRYAPYKLSAAEEDIMAERDAAADAAWQELHKEQLATLVIPFDGGDGVEDHSLDKMLSYALHPDRDLRKRASEETFAALEPRVPVLAAAYNALIGDRLVDDRLRSRGDDPMLLTHLDNELAPATVESMMGATTKNYELARRWFRAKAGLLGVDQVAAYDVYAPLGESGEGVLFAEGRQIVLDSLADFSPEMAALAADFFSEQRLDAETRPGKTGGAFAAPMSRAARPFILMNYTDRLNDVSTLAHELGHGIQFELTTAAQPPLVTEVGLALAEVPSTFAEMVVFNRLLERIEDPAVRLHLLAGEVEQSFAAVFRQTSMARFERAAYLLRKEGKSLRPERLNELWLAEQESYFQDAVEIPAWTHAGWSYIPHFIWTRFYTYAYTFAYLVALTLYGRYRAEGTAFAGPYLDFLRQGGSASPADQLRALGVDIDDPRVWDDAFAEMSRQVDVALEAAAAVQATELNASD
jgi:oligoendopeptidase F